MVTQSSQSGPHIRPPAQLCGPEECGPFGVTGHEVVNGLILVPTANSPPDSNQPKYKYSKLGGLLQGESRSWV
jgi:hypothetical protein